MCGDILSASDSGRLIEENLERSTQSLELALSFKREEDLDRYGEYPRNLVGSF